ncbi:MAG: hypothetical protein ACO3HT_08565 [Ilumatobacteraceae bacterium]
MSTPATPSRSRWDVLLVFAAGVMIAFAVLSVVLAGRSADAADRSAVRVVSGCESVVEIPSAGRYLVSIEVRGPSLSTDQACREIPAGLRQGGLSSLRVLSKSGAEAVLPISEVNASRLVDGGQRGSLGAIEVDAAGEFIIELEATGDVVATFGPDPSVLRTNGWWWGVGWLLGAVISGLLVIRPKSGKRRLDGTGQWAAPLASDRIG